MKQLLHSIFALFLGGLVAAAMGCHSTTEAGSANTGGRQSVKGTVQIANTGVVLSGVMVSLSLPDSVSTQTDAGGAFKIDSVPPGNYTLYASKSGFVTSRQSIRVDSGSDAHVTIQLSPSKVIFTLSLHITSTTTGAGLTGATVNVFDNPLRTAAKTTLTTDANGYTSFTNDTLGWYYFEASSLGYETAVDSVYMIPGQTYALAFSLSKRLTHLGFADSLVTSYSFSNNCIDSTGNGHNGTAHGCTFVADRFGNPSNAIQFNGTTDYVTVPNAPDMNFGTSQNFTITTWFNYSKLQTANITSYLLYKGIVTSDETSFRGYHVGLIESGGLSLADVFLGTSSGFTTTSATALTADSKWHFLAVEFDRTGFVQIYIDGALSHSGGGSFGFQYMGGNINSTEPLMIGGDGVALNGFKGKLDDIRIYRGLLPASYMDSLYHH